MGFKTAFGELDCSYVRANFDFNTARCKEGELRKELQWLCDFKIELDGHVFSQMVYCGIDEGCEPDIYLPHRFFGEDGSDDCREVATNVAKALAELLTINAQWQSVERFDLISDITLDALLLYAYPGSLSEWLRKNLPYVEQVINRKHNSGGYVYLLTDELGHYKIGKAANIDRRIYQLKTQPPFKLRLLAKTWFPNPYLAERSYHSEHAQQRLNGEWFDLDDAALGYVKSSLNLNSAYLFNLQEAWNFIADGKTKAETDACIVKHISAHYNDLPVFGDHSIVDLGMAISLELETQCDEVEEVTL